MSYSLVDLGILTFLVLFAIVGVRRGFLSGVADIVGMFVAFMVAIRGYAIISGPLSSFTPLPHILGNFIALMGLFLLAEWLFGLLVSPVLRFIHRYLLFGPLGVLDTIGGLLPGLIKGLLIVATLVAFFVLFPVNTALRDEVRQSVLGEQLSNGVSAAAPSLETLFGGSLQETALFITQPTESEAPRRMNFPPDLVLREDTAAEERMFLLVNAERVKAGLKPLVLDERLRAVALAHSEDMFRRNYFAHESPDGESPADRLTQAHIPFIAMGENLAYAPNVEIAHTGLMNSPGHRQNILSPSFGRIGIGVVDGGIYGKMFSQEFTN